MPLVPTSVLGTSPIAPAGLTPPTRSYEDIMVVLQESDDCGATFTKPRIIWPDHGIMHQIVVTVIQNARKELLIPCDHDGIPPYKLVVRSMHARSRGACETQNVRHPKIDAEAGVFQSSWRPLHPVTSPQQGDQSVIQHAPMSGLYNRSQWTVKGGKSGGYSNTGSHHSSIVELQNGSYIAVGR